MLCIMPKFCIKIDTIDHYKINSFQTHSNHNSKISWSDKTQYKTIQKLILIQISMIQTLKNLFKHTFIS